MCRGKRHRTAGSSLWIRPERGPNISLERVETSIAPASDELSAIHLDLYTEDQKTEVERLVALGATRYAHETPDGADFVVLVDPDGYRFCVVQK